MIADLVIKGKIYTADSRDRFVSRAAVKDGRIVAVGGEKDILPFVGGTTEIVQAKGLVIPGIVEGHAHITCSTEMIYGVALTQHAEHYETYLEDIRRFWEAHPEVEVITGSGYENGAFDRIGPTAELLDRITDKIPIVLIGSDHHSRWLNSAALALTGIDDNTPNPKAGEIVRYPDGRATGWLKEAAALYTSHIIPPVTRRQYAGAVAYYQDIAASHGVTSAFEPFYDARGDYYTRAEGYRLLEKSGGLNMQMRLGYSIEVMDDVEEKFRDMEKIRNLLSDCEKVKLTSAKFFVDGVVECHTAYLSEDYSDRPGNKGEPTCTQEWLNANTLRALRAGFDLHAHIIGDGAAQMGLTAYENAQNIVRAERGEQDFRNAFTHLQILKKEQIARMARDGILAVTNPYWHSLNPMYYDEIEKPFLGRERAGAEYPMKSLCDAGLHISRASDFPVTIPPKTTDCLHFMVNRAEPGSDTALNPDECIDITRALKILTMGGAYQLRLEDTKGSIEPGKDADFAFIDKDPYALPKEDLHTCRIEKTYIGGKCVYTK